MKSSLWLLIYCVLQLGKLVYLLKSILLVPIHIKIIFMKLGPTAPVIFSPTHLRDHSWPYGGPEDGAIENILFNRCYLFQYKLWSNFMELAESDISSPAHLSDHSWHYGEPEDGPMEDILHPIDFTCSIVRYSRCSWRKVQHDQRYPLRPTFRTTLGRSVGWGVGTSTIWTI